MKDLPEEKLRELLNQIGQGGNQACETLYRHYECLVYAYLRQHIKADDYTLDGLVNEVLLVPLRKPHAFQWQSRFSTWLLGIAKRKCLEFFRREKRHDRVDEIDDELLAEIPDEAPGPSEMLDMKQDASALQYCLEQLPADQADSILHVLLGGLTVEEAAAAMQCPPGTIKSRIFNAKAKLKTCIENWIRGGRHG